MRALRPMTETEREFAEQKHDLVIDFLRRKRLPMDDFYDVVIFGYLSAVQQYFRNPPAGVEFKAMAFRAMTKRQIEDKALLEQAASVATPKEAKIIRLLVDGFALHEAARLLKLPRAVAVTCIENFCCRAKGVIG